MEVSKPNPASPAPKRVTEATRVPMSLPNQKLAVPDIPNYFLYWHLGKNVPRALRAGYTFVDEEDVELEQHGIANDVTSSGSTDMGTRISVSAGGDDEERLYLMKLPQEFRDQDMAAQAQVNEGVAQSLRAGNIGADKDPDSNRRYMKAGQDLFYPKGKR